MDRSVRYRTTAECEVAAFGDGVAILDLRSNTYFSLNATGRFVFEALAEPLAIDEIVDRVAAKYGVEAETCRPDVRRLLDDLRAHRLVELV